MNNDPRMKGILAELTSYTPHKTRHHFVETRGQQMIAGFINLITLIEETYDEEEANDLKKRLFNSIKSGNDKKFMSGMKRIMESQNAK